MNNEYLIKKVIKNIKNKKKYLIAYSGGIDSSALLQIMYDLNKIYFKKISLRAIHINHNLNINSNIWVRHCYLFCKERNIKLIIKNIYIKKKKNIENTARNLRYKFFKKIIINNEILLLAHHLQDQCETFLLALKRGSGPKGLSCMPFKKKIGKNYLIRPFLNINKKYIQKYILIKKIKYIIDKSNYNIKFDRNYIRIKILPLIIKKWPNFYISIFKSTILCSNQEKFINNIINKKILLNQNKKKALFINYLKKKKKKKSFLIIKNWINKFNLKTPSYKIIKNIWYEIILSNKKSKPKLINKLYKIIRYSKYLYLLFNNKFNKISKLLINKIEGFILKAPNIKTKINIKFILKGKYKILGKMHLLNEKKIWKEFGIPPWLRNKIPLLYYNEKLISAIGFFITNYGKIKHGDKIINIKIHK
ncbi:MAG: tRNA lysidine(34) synthetase TilS [Enterobacteriaceae bacterium PSpyr]|nr:MAG: tRNA lysidine(34) synthetase TilS [Enterobacteriaceae bacterium PSpyr]